MKKRQKADQYKITHKVFSTEGSLDPALSSENNNKSKWHTQPTVWAVPYACAQPYHPGSGSHGQLFRPCWASSAWHSRRAEIGLKACVVWSWRLKGCFAPASAVQGRLHRAFSPISARRLCHADEA